MTTYAWIITKDHLGGDDDSEVGVIGPRTATAEQVSALKTGAGYRFRMYDDDGEPYYDGRIIFAPALSAEDGLPEEAFGPLDDFGAPNAGCTEIRYFNKNNRLETL